MLYQTYKQSCLLNISANPAHFHQNWAGLAVLFFRKILNPSSLLRTFSLSATSTHNLCLQSIFGKNALIWGHFENVWYSRFWGHWGQRTFEVEFLGYNLENLKSFLKVWLPTPKGLYDKWFQNSDLFVFFIVPQRLTIVSNAKRKISFC